MTLVDVNGASECRAVEAPKCDTCQHAVMYYAYRPHARLCRQPLGMTGWAIVDPLEDYCSAHELQEEAAQCQMQEMGESD